MKIISFPRSGQHLVERFLRFYHKENNLEYSYCEYYKHCLKIPCADNCVFQKNHDWNLDLAINEDEKYIALYRSNAQKQLDSFYRHNSKKSKLIKNLEIKEYYYFINKNKIYYNKFVKKWIKNSNEKILKIDYEDLIINPMFNLNLILRHIFKKFNEESITNFLKIEKINDRHKKIKIIKLFN
jgi:hypothetical protein